MSEQSGSKGEKTKEKKKKKKKKEKKKKKKVHYFSPTFHFGNIAAMASCVVFVAALVAAVVLQGAEAKLDLGSLTEFGHPGVDLGAQ